MKLARMFFKKLVYTSCVQLFNTEKISLSVRLLEEGSLYYKSLPKNSEKTNKQTTSDSNFLNNVHCKLGI